MTIRTRPVYILWNLLNLGVIIYSGILVTEAWCLSKLKTRLALLSLLLLVEKLLEETTLFFIF